LAGTIKASGEDVVKRFLPRDPCSGQPNSCAKSSFTTRITLAACRRRRLKW
jgi:hypothetical protein